MAEKQRSATNVPPETVRARLDKLVSDRSDTTFFRHGDGVRQSEANGSTTRTLCAAAYLDENYAEATVAELVEDGRRAVVPSLGYNLVAVARHSLAALRLFLARNVVLVLVLLAALTAAPGPTVWLFGVFVIAGLPSWLRQQHDRWSGNRVLLAATISVASALWLFAPLLFLTASTMSGDIQSAYRPPANGLVTESGTPGSSVVSFVTPVVATLLVLLAVVAGFHHRAIRIVARDLAPGRPTTMRPASPVEVEQRMRLVAMAESGNVLLHSGYRPFLGAGVNQRTWSIALPLRPDQPRYGSEGFEQAQVDPVELLAYVRQRIAALRSVSLPEPARMKTLRLRDYVIASSTRWRDLSLIDPVSGLPFSYATQEAVDAIIRSPQSGVRHFLRVTIGLPGTAVGESDARSARPSASTSTFLHVEAKGGMLYLEVLEFVLGPLRRRYLDADRYLTGPPPGVSTAVCHAWLLLAPTVVLAAPRLLNELFRRVRSGGALGLTARSAGMTAARDVGARAEARELASEDSPNTYLQHLDAQKNLRVVAARMTGAIGEFLGSRGIDVTEFKRLMATPSDSIFGSAAGGRNAATPDRRG